MSTRTALILELTSKCNLRCLHCYADHISNVCLDRALATSAIRRAFSRALMMGADGIDIIFHGAEPLLWGFHRFERLMGDIENEASATGIDFLLIVQTNGLLLGSNFLELFKKHQARLSISLDYPKAAHDLLRVTRNGDPTFENALQSIELCRHYSVPANATCVVSKLNLDYPEKIYDFFQALSLSFTVNPLQSAYSGDSYIDSLRPTSEQYSEFLVRLCRRFVSDEKGNITIDNLEDLINSLASGVPKGCFYSRNCAKAMFTVDPRGEVKVCPRWHGPCEGTIEEAFDASVPGIAAAFVDRRRESLEIGQCKNCRWWEICNGGCPMNTELDACGRDTYCTSYGSVRKLLTDFLPAVSS